MLETPQTLLFRLKQKNNAQDWERFVQLFTPILFRWVGRLGVPENDAEDVLQELFLLLFKHLSLFAYESEKSFHAWLWTVTRRFVRDWQQRTRRPIPLESLQHFAASDKLTAQDNQEFASYLVERGLSVVQADFQPTTWAVFLAVAIEERSGPEVAKQFGITTNAVYLAYSRVLHRLRTELTGFLE